MRTQVGIIGAGPAGLMLAHLLHRAGIESVVIEDKSRHYIEHRLRAGLLEQGSADLMIETGVGERLLKERMYHEGLYIKFNGRMHRIDFKDLVGKGVMIYAQQEVVKDLVATRLGYGAPIHFEVSDVSIHGFDDRTPSIRFRDKDGNAQTLECDYIAGCDGYHGISRSSVPESRRTEFVRDYPFAWLGILAEAPPAEDVLVYTHHPRGFALQTMRGPELTRLYFQLPREERIEDWSDERIWAEFRIRLDGEGHKLNEGPITQKGITDMRSFVVEPMQYGRLFLAGDAAHILPPTGAKGMNLAFADVQVLSRGLVEYYKNGSTARLENYSRVCLRRVWKVQRFSWWVTALLHRFDVDNAFDQRRQVAEIDYLTSSRAAKLTWAENYVGLPMEWD